MFSTFSRTYDPYPGEKKKEVLLEGEGVSQESARPRRFSRLALLQILQITSNDGGQLTSRLTMAMMASTDSAISEICSIGQVLCQIIGVSTGQQLIGVFLM